MTLIAAVRCIDGLAIAADSQETVTHSDGSEYRRTVQKIVPLIYGGVQVIIAGGGDAEAIEGFKTRFERNGQAQNIATLFDFVSTVESELTNFYTEQALLNVAVDMTLLVAASHPSSREYDVWKSSRNVLVPIETSTLVGWDESLYHRVLNTDQTLSLQQGMLTALHTITVAEETSNTVRGPISAVTVRSNGIHVEESRYVALMKSNLLDYEEHVNRLFVSCADTGINLSRFEGVLVEFCARVLFMHKVQIDGMVREMLRRGLNSGTGDPYPRVPPGFTVTLAGGDFDQIYTEAEKAALLDRIRTAYRPKPT